MQRLGLLPPCIAGMDLAFLERTMPVSAVHSSNIPAGRFSGLLDAMSPGDGPERVWQQMKHPALYIPTTPSGPVALCVHKFISFLVSRPGRGPADRRRQSYGSYAYWLARWIDLVTVPDVSASESNVLITFHPTGTKMRLPNTTITAIEATRIAVLKIGAR
jgi:hypothetical protein